MLRFKSQCIYIEGPDLSGKTTLIREIHGATKYAYHLMDRSHVSRDLFARKYGRPTDPMLDHEVNNLNNRYFILDPSEEIIVERYRTRGDEIHDLEGVLSVRNDFRSLKDHWIGSLPNVTFVPIGLIPTPTESVLVDIKSLESYKMSDLARECLKHAQARGGETWGLNFTIHETGGFEQVAEASADPEDEVDYYAKITDGFLQKIDREMRGDNEYSLAQGPGSRRFVYNSDTCISFMQLGIRETADFSVVIRSSNLTKTLVHDLKFIHRICRDAQIKLLGRLMPTTIRVMINSAHVVP